MRGYFSLTSKTGVEVARKQFPSRLAYARTSHKCQGATLVRSAVDASTYNFAHGQLYVMLSRTRCKRDVIIYNPGFSDGGVCFSGNVVWRDVLRKFGLGGEEAPSVRRTLCKFKNAKIAPRSGTKHADLAIEQFGVY